MKESNRISDVLTHLTNQKELDIWEIRKDIIKICKDCQFRYMCIDDRIPIFDSENQEWIYQTDCIYDPYTNLWKN